MIRGTEYDGPPPNDFGGFLLNLSTDGVSLVRPLVEIQDWQMEVGDVEFVLLPGDRTLRLYLRCNDYDDSC